jgi:enediyne biosynthesis protein E4
MRLQAFATVVVLSAAVVHGGCANDPPAPAASPAATTTGDPFGAASDAASMNAPASPAAVPAMSASRAEPRAAVLPPPGTGGFTDVTRAAGLHFTHSFGDEHFSNLAEAIGGGVIFLDYDGDGWLDVYLTTGTWVEGISKGAKPAGTPVNRLYRNRRDGTFEDVTERTGVGAPGRFSTGAAAADYDGDGHTDLYVCNYNGSQLFRNNGDGTFTDVTKRAGVGNADRFAVAATWLDYDGDGLLDLYVVNYVEFAPDYNLFYAPDGFPGPLAYKGQPDRLYRNRGDGTFQDVSEAADIARFAGRGMSVAAGDVNGDGRDDIYVTNDQMENYLFRNDGNGRFSEIGLPSFAAYNGGGDSTASMGVDIGDVDGDGLPDLFVSDEALSSLYRNEGDGTFTDAVFESGIARSSAQFVGWGAFLFDYDNDGDLDLLKVNSDLSRLFGQEDQLYANAGRGRFEDVSERMGDHFRQALRGRGAAYADYDNDGDLDVVINNLHGPPVLLRNDVGSRNNWLLVRLVGQRSNRDGIGARLELTAGGTSQVRFRRSASGYLSQNDPRVHFGLGQAGVVERLVITWPSGVRQQLEGVAVNQVLTVHEPPGAVLTTGGHDGARR